MGLADKGENIMKVLICDQFTGTCPDCKFYEDCNILDKLEEFMKNLVQGKEEDSMELVIYKCPKFDGEIN